MSARRLIYIIALVLGVAAVASGCGRVRLVTTTVQAKPYVSLAYSDPLGVHVPLTLEQLQVINKYISGTDTLASQAPDIADSVADIEIGHRPGQLVGAITVTYFFFCGASDTGSATYSVTHDGRAKLIGSEPSNDPTVGTMCTPRR